MKLVFATHNLNKLKEVQSKLPLYTINSLTDLGQNEEIPETGLSLEENALIKARFLNKKYNIDCFADDTGLEIDALNNEPGVYSARYAGEEKSSEKNMELVLKKLQNTPNRKARFRTVIALIQEGKETLIEGIVEGNITKTKQGNSGFGYDPIFIPNGYDISFAEMDMETKNRISHRGLAIDKLVNFLK